MTEESSRVDVGRVVADGEDGSEGEGEGEEYAEVEDMVRAWNADRVGQGGPSGVKKGATFVRR
jgi:hypothetical protein